MPRLTYCPACSRVYFDNDRCQHCSNSMKTRYTEPVPQEAFRAAPTEAATTDGPGDHEGYDPDLSAH